MHTSPNAIVVVGSLHYDIMIEAPHRPAKGETVTGSRWYPKFGGKGGNQAVAAARAGCPTRMVGAVGNDDFATFVMARLRASGVDTSRVATVAGAGTGMSVACLDAERDYGAVIVSGANLAIDPTALADPSLWRGAALLIMQDEVAEAVNIAAATAARQRGVKVCLNAAPVRPLAAALAALVDILVVNAVEALAMTGVAVTSLATACDAAAALARRFPTAVVTAGSDGVAAASAGAAALSLPALPVEVVSTHGAGDAFVGTLCAEIAQGKALGDALERANAEAARQVSGRGGAEAGV